MCRNSCDYSALFNPEKIEMSVVLVESAIHSLAKTVADLQCKVSSLENIILEQNKTIKKLISVCENSCVTNIKVNIDEDEGTCCAKQRKPPMREGSDRPSSVNIVRARETNQASPQSELIVAAESTRVKAPVIDAMASPSMSDQPWRDISNTAQRSLSAHKAVSEISADTVQAQQQGSDWVNVKRRRPRRAMTTSNNVEAARDETPQVLNVSGKNCDNLTKMPAKISPINRGSNTSVLSLKAVERKKYLHVWRLLSDTTESNVEDYLRNILGENSFIKVDKIIPKIEKAYSSFRICVSEGNFKKLCEPDVWPKDVEYSEWMFFRTATKNKNQTK